MELNALANKHAQAAWDRLCREYPGLPLALGPSAGRGVYVRYVIRGAILSAMKEAMVESANNTEPKVEDPRKES